MSQPFPGALPDAVTIKRMNAWTDSTLDWWAHWGNYLAIIIPVAAALSCALCIYIAIKANDELAKRKETSVGKIVEDLKAGRESDKRLISETREKADEAARELALARKELGARVAEAQAVAERAKARTDKRALSVEQRAAFVNAMAGFRGQRVSVYHDARDPEAEGYAGALSAALRDAGVGLGEYSGIEYDPKPEGVIVYCNDPRNPSPLPVGLQRALRASGVSAELSQVPGWAAVDGPNWAGLWVPVLG